MENINRFGSHFGFSACVFIYSLHKITSLTLFQLWRQNSVALKNTLFLVLKNTVSELFFKPRRFVKKNSWNETNYRSFLCERFAGVRCG